MSSEILKRLQSITNKLNKLMQDKSIIKLPMSDSLIDDITKSLGLIKENCNQKEEVIGELVSIYHSLKAVYCVVASDCWDSFRHSLANNEPLSDKYDIKAAYKNLNIAIEGLKLLHNNDSCKAIIGSEEDRPFDEIISFQKKMKEALEKMQQQSAASQKQKERSELEKKAKEEFGKYIKNGTIDLVSIKEGGNSISPFYAEIKLKDSNKNADIKIS